jgi:hypothetical protein
VISFIRILCCAPFGGASSLLRHGRSIQGKSHFLPVVFRWCFGGVLVVFWWCFGGAPAMSRNLPPALCRDTQATSRTKHRARKFHLFDSKPIQCFMKKLQPIKGEQN